MYYLDQGHRKLMDREALAAWTRRSERTIRTHCEIIDYINGRAIYDADASADLLEKVPTRSRAA